MDEFLGRYRYEGRGEVALSDWSPRDSWNAIFNIEHSLFSPSTFTTEIRITHESSEHGFNQESLNDIYHEASTTGTLTIESTNPPDYPIFINQISNMSICMDTLTITHESYNLGLTSNYSLAREELSASIKLTRCGFIEPRSDFRRQSYDGTIIYSDSSEHEITELSSNIGAVQFSLNYGYANNLRIEQQKAVIQCRSPQLHVIVDDPPQSPKDIFDQLETEFEDLICLISFFSRESVYITELKLQVAIDRGVMYPPPQRKKVYPKLSGDSTPMFTHSTFEVGELDQVWKRFRKLDSYDVLVRAIPFHCTSVNTKDLASSYFLAHAALEAVCKFITRDLKGKKIDGRKITDPLRVYYALERLGIDVENMGFWQELGLMEGLRKTFTLRNDLFHETKISNPEMLNYNLFRLNYLFELVVMNLLEIDYCKKGFRPVG